MVLTSLLSVDYGWKNCAHCLLQLDEEAQELTITTYPVYDICNGVEPVHIMHNSMLSGALIASYFATNPLPLAQSLVVEAPPEIKGQCSRGASGLVGAIAAVFVLQNTARGLDPSFVHKECNRRAVMAHFGIASGRGHEASKQSSIAAVAALGLKTEHTDSDHVCDAILQGLYTWRFHSLMRLKIVQS